ncbi:MAG: phosphatidate cytidylyltransferase [Gammaproteobacteria bacterium]
MTAGILIPLVLLSIFYLPLIGIKLVLGILLLGSAYEYGKLCDLPHPFTAIFSASLVALFLVLAFVPFLGELLTKVVALGGIFWVWAFCLLGLYVKFNQTLWGWEGPFSKSLIGTGLLLPAFIAMTMVIAINPWWLLAGLTLVWAADSGAYFAGRTFGKRFLAKSISPKKTWEGAAGGLIASLVVGVLFYAFVPVIQATSFLVWFYIIIAVTGFSIIGDLFESMLKRVAGVKDSGTLLPGHGGLLDRIDGLLAAMPIYALLIL